MLSHPSSAFSGAKFPSGRRTEGGAEAGTGGSKLASAVYWGYIGIMERKTETTRDYRGYLGFI